MESLSFDGIIYSIYYGLWHT